MKRYYVHYHVSSSIIYHLSDTLYITKIAEIDIERNTGTVEVIYLGFVCHNMRRFVSSRIT